MRVSVQECKGAKIVLSAKCGVQKENFSRVCCLGRVANRPLLALSASGLGC
jgi:hypothetical protein